MTWKRSATAETTCSSSRGLEPSSSQTEVPDPVPGPGEVVVDVGCGTGVNFDLLRAGVGPTGRIIAVEPCPEMLARARWRVERQGWQNVTLIEAAAEEVTLSGPADAALFCATHDVMRSPQALLNVVSQVNRGGRVVAGGPKRAPWWTPWGSRRRSSPV